MKIFLFLLLSSPCLFGQFSLPAVIYGTVTDQSGTVIDSTGSNEDVYIVILREGVEVARDLLEAGATENYRLQIFGVSGQPEYVAMLERSGVQSGLLPLSPAVNPFALTQEEVTQIDFVEGEDSDLDGLSDEWEAFQLGLVGILAGDPDFDLAAFTPDGDFDWDGLTNAEEFVTGTAATIFESKVNFRILGPLSGGRIEASFDSVVGRTYLLESTTDFIDWEPVEITIQGNQMTQYRPSVNATVSVNFLEPTANSFYRMNVE